MLTILSAPLVVTLPAARAPEPFHASVGVAQMSCQLAFELLAYDDMWQRYREAGDATMVRRLEASPPTATFPLPEGYMAVHDTAMHALGSGTTRATRSVITGVLVPSLLSRSPTLAAKGNPWHGQAFSSRGDPA